MYGEQLQLKTKMETEINVTVHSKVEQIRRELEIKIMDLVRDNEQLTAALTIKSKELEGLKVSIRSQTEQKQSSLRLVEVVRVFGWACELVLWEV